MIEAVLKPKASPYERHSVVPIAEVFTVMRLVAEKPAWQASKPIINGQKVGVGSLRLRTFLTKGTTCVACGLKASHFAIEHLLRKRGHDIHTRSKRRRGGRTAP